MIILDIYKKLCIFSRAFFFRSEPRARAPGGGRERGEDGGVSHGHRRAADEDGEHDAILGVVLYGI